MVVVFKISSQDRVQRLRPLLRTLVLVPWVSRFWGFFRTFPLIQKSGGLGPRSGSELGADFNPWTPAAYAGSMTLKDDESEPGSESGSEEEATTRFEAGFRPLRVCMRFLELHMGRPVRVCAHEQQLASYFPD